MLVIERVHARHGDAFIQAAQASRDLHSPWISAPLSGAAFAAHLKRYAREEQASFVVLDDRQLAGCINLNEIVYGALESAYLGYYAFSGFEGRGIMKQAMRLVVEEAFGRMALHRVEANIQPDNLPSKALVQSLGFRLEGFSPRYIYVGGAWQDHERYALTVEDWPAA